jgi:Zn-dependent peptidase ImmA (M78 family)
MILDFTKAKTVFLKVKHVREEMRRYCLAPDRFDLSIEDLQHVVSGMYTIQIVKKQVAYEGTFVRGLIERYQKSQSRVVIYIKKNIDDDAKRFVAVKELCHVVIDEKEDWSPEGEKTIETLLIEYVVNNGETAQTPSQSEILAEIAAIELMYPYDLRILDAAKLANKETSLQKIANTHKMPEEIVSRSLSKWYQDMAKRLWDEVGFG